MEPVTKSDLKELMKELRESVKESIREAVAAAFGNSQPALEHATTSTATQLLAMDASDANSEVPSAACSGLDPGTSATDLSPTAVVYPPATETASDHDNNYIVRTPATCSTKCSGPVGASVTVGAILATTGCMPTTYLAEWVAHTNSGIIDLSSMTTLPICLTTASTLHPWLQRVPPRPPDPRKIFWEEHGVMLSGSSDWEAHMRPIPNASLCRVGQSQEVNLSCLFDWMYVSWQRLVHLLVFGVELRPITWPSWECNCGWKLLVRRMVSFTEGRYHNLWSIFAYWGSLEFNHIILHSHRTSIFDPMWQWGYGGCTSLGIATQISGGSAVVQGTMMLIDTSVNWQFLITEEIERSGSYSSDNMNFGGKEVFITRLLTSMFCCNTTKSAVIQSCFWPEQHIIEECFASLGHRVTYALVFVWFYTHISDGQLLEVGNQLKCKWRIQSGLRIIQVQSTFSRAGVVLTCRSIGLSVEQLPETVHSCTGSLYVAYRQWLVPWLEGNSGFTTACSSLQGKQTVCSRAKFVIAQLMISDGTECWDPLLLVHTYLVGFCGLKWDIRITVSSSILVAVVQNVERGAFFTWECLRRKFPIPLMCKLSTVGGIIFTSLIPLISLRNREHINCLERPAATYVGVLLAQIKSLYPARTVCSGFLYAILHCFRNHVAKNGADKGADILGLVRMRCRMFLLDSRISIVLLDCAYQLEESKDIQSTGRTTLSAAPAAILGARLGTRDASSVVVNFSMAPDRGQAMSQEAENVSLLLSVGFSTENLPQIEKSRSLLSTSCELAYGVQLWPIFSIWTSHGIVLMCFVMELCHQLSVLAKHGLATRQQCAAPVQGWDAPWDLDGSLQFTTSTFSRREECLRSGRIEQVPVGHKYYFVFNGNVFNGDHDDKDHYLNNASSFDLIQVHLIIDYYGEDYHQDSSSTKERQMSWDPGGNSTVSAWGQAEFQGGRGVSNLPPINCWALGRHQREGPTSKPW